MAHAPSRLMMTTDRDGLAALFRRDTAIHVYGLADLEDRFWDNSVWWRDGAAAVGRVRLPGPEGVVAVYAISPRAPDLTTALLTDVVDQIPAGALVLAPVGADEAMARVRAVDSFGTHVKMSISPAALREPVGAGSAEVLSTDDLADLQALYDTDPGAAYFLPSMLRAGVFVGVREAGRLVAAGGTHVLSEQYGVAGLGGIITAPDARGRGHAAAVTARLSRLLLDRGLTVGLNVKASNAAAVGVYRRLGFIEIHRYVEFELGV
ncbi:GNAT family N-acetyltransferase [Euzebya tangerina]|uniref:GNAT family N-acetyltransferase n=1 Tax=Euzebya tangerina TaxID=591198 RepID=UPI000E31C856|nr:GNAT family N-acetyltransferase [Euzebya tangerina]